MSNTIHIATPCMNAVETIDRTIQSVVTQAGRFRIRYHVQDGGSTDGTVERLAWWQARLHDDSFPLACQGVDFSYTSAADAGMYDALVRAIERMVCFRHSFITWINADDVFIAGAFAQVNAVHEQFTSEQISWVSGAAAIVKDDRIIFSGDTRVATAALKAGLCDGVHWSTLQQEGTFFRRWLWDAIKPDVNIRPLKLAGDWNLWRLFAQRASLAQFTVPLGAFRIREGQLSAKHRDLYMQEIESLVPTAERRQVLEGMLRGKAPLRRRLEAKYPEVQLVLIEEDCETQLREHCLKVLQVERPASVPPSCVKHHVISGNLDSVAPTPVGPLPRFRFETGIAAHDGDWQFPAITEKHAFDQLRRQGGAPPGVVYVAFPWATLIDKMQTGAPDAGEHLDLFRRFVRWLPNYGTRITVCQHILMKRYIALFVDAGIEHVFWTHATYADAGRLTHGVQVHAFPLYPVQLPVDAEDGATDTDGAPRRWLFSFIGARPSQYYLTQVRTWILDELGNETDGLVVGRDKWHYQTVVYEHQMRGNGLQSGGTGTTVADSNATQFQDSLLTSTFSLCPSGSGPNSIRLWESIGTGSIPVILADTWLPPGPHSLWEQAAVFCAETPDAVRALPGRLRAIAAEPDQLRRMRHGLRQLNLLYGKESFVTDILALMYRLTVRQASGERAGAAALLAGLVELDTRPGDRLPEADARLALTLLGGQLLLEADANRAVLAADGRYRRLKDRALVSLPLNHPAAVQFNEVATAAAELQIAQRPRLGAVATHRRPAVSFIGRHSRRTPLSYPPIRSTVTGMLDFVDDPKKADILICGFDIDLTDNAALVAEAQAARPDQRIVVLSEEPLWDLTWSRSNGARTSTLHTANHAFEVTSLNHETSSIYCFERLPYFVLTNDDYLVRYRHMLSPSVRRSAKALREFWQREPLHTAFYLERRTGDAYERHRSGAHSFGLSVFRTRLAETVQRGHVTRVGKGWNQATRRQALPDWHLDKLAALQGRTHLCSAIENVHHRDYITEKIFDAYAVGAVPIYCAGPDHRIGELVPGRPFVEVGAQDLAADVRTVEGFVPDADFCERYEAAQQRLYELVSDWGTVAAERARVGGEVVRALDELL
jgi:hypothetical protein